MKIFPGQQKKYLRFPSPSSSLVDYNSDYTDYYPYPISTSQEQEFDSEYSDESYHMKGDIL